MAKNITNTTYENDYASGDNENTFKSYSLFPNDDVFYAVIIVLITVLIIFGIILLVCMVCKPSYLHQKLVISHPIEFLQDINDKTVSEFTFTNSTIKHKEQINQVTECGKNTEPNEASMQDTNVDISTLDIRRLPPLEPQENNSIKRREITKLRNDLEKVENPQDNDCTDRTSIAMERKTSEQLDIMSLTHMDDGFD